MKVALFALFLLVVAGCNSVAASEPTPAPKVDDAARDRCIFAIVQELNSSRSNDYDFSVSSHECKPYFPASWADTRNPY